LPTIKITRKLIIKSWFVIIAIALLVAIYLYAYMGIFSRYLADDYCTAGSVKLLGFIQAIKTRRYSWDGRFTFTFLIMLFSLFGNKFSAILPSIAITAWLSSFYYFFRQIAKRFFVQPGKLPVFVVSLLVAFIIIYSIPNVAENFYWMTGISTYLFAVIFEVLLLGFLIQVLPEMGKRSLFKKIIYSILFFIFSFICSGNSEVSTALNVVIFGILLLIGIVVRITKKTSSSQLIYLFIMFLGAFLGFIYMATAPGNEIRNGGPLVLTAHPGIVELFINSLLISSKFSIKWLINYSNIIWPVSILLVLIGIYFSSTYSFRIGFYSRDGIKYFAYYLFFMFLLVFVTLIPTYWVMGTFPRDRILVLPITILSGTIVSCSFLLGCLLNKAINFTDYSPKTLHLVLSILCIYFVVSVPINLARHYYLENISVQRNFSEEWDKGNEQIMNDINNGKKTIITNTILYNLVDIERIRSEPDFWVNQCAASYYQVDKIIGR